MENSIIEITDEEIFYKNNSYRFSIENIKKINFGKKRSVVILGEELYIKRVKLNKKVKIKEGDIEGVIERSFGLDEDYLFHYHFSKKNLELIIYAIKGGIRIKELCMGASKIKVIPLQIFFCKRFKSKAGCREWESLFTYKGSFYYLLFKDEYIHKSFVEEDKDRFLQRVLELDGITKKRFIDKNIEQIIPTKFNNYEIRDFEGVLNEKRLHKQRFFTI